LILFGEEGARMDSYLVSRARAARGSQARAMAVGIVLGMLTLPAAMATGQNVLANGGAEAGDLEGWSTSSPQLTVVASQTQQAGVVQPDGGAFFFTFSGQTGTNASFRQDAARALTAGSLLRFRGRVSTEQNTENDFGVATVRLRDAAGVVLAESSTEALTTPSNVWGDFSIELIVPAGGAAAWEVELSGSRVWGSFINVFFDTLILEVEPGPPAVPGLGVPGGVGLGLTLGSLGQLARRRDGPQGRRRRRGSSGSRAAEPGEG